MRHTYLAEAAPLLSFNPRTHEGCDNKQHKNYFIALVSIHAPTRGATCRWKNRKCYWSFNPRTHEGCDYKIQQIISRIWSFNPRTHEGCDCKNTLCKQTQQVSIHAPTRGATQQPQMLDAELQFQSTHPRGVRPFDLGLGLYVYNVSIHAPTRGATP